MENVIIILYTLVGNKHTHVFAVSILRYGIGRNYNEIQDDCT